jgi:hypothetical protein
MKKYKNTKYAKYEIANSKIEKLQFCILSWSFVADIYSQVNEQR